MTKPTIDLQKKLNAYEQENLQLHAQLALLNSKIELFASRQNPAPNDRLLTAILLEKLGVWEWNPATNELFLCGECRNILGFNPQETVALPHILSRIHPEDAPRVQLEVKKAAQTSGTHEITLRILGPDQTIHWVKVKCKTTINEENSTFLMVGTVVDCTENKKNQDKLQLSERLFKSVAQNIPKSLIIIVDKDHRFVAIEGDIMENAGYNSSIFTGKPSADESDVYGYESTKDLYTRMLSGEHFSEERKSETGEIYMVHFVPLKNDNKEVEAGLIIALDITDIKDAEVKSAKLAAIIESSDDAIISKTFNGVITSWNDSAERIFGYTAVEMIGKSILTLIPENRQHEENDFLSRMRKGQRIEHFETKRVRKDGSILDVSLTISPIRDAQGKIIGLSKIARDITERKQEEQRKNDFVAIVSHELKTPLTSLIGYIQLLLGKVKKQELELLPGLLLKAENQAKKMATMIQDFLDMAKMEDGKLQIVPVKFNLFALLEEILTDTQFKSPYHQINVQVNETVNVYADREKIGQVLINLLSNAIKYTPNGGNIDIGCKITDGKADIFVRDQGIGINAIDQKRLFDRFFRVNDDRIKSISGFGIGLYFVSEILRYHQSNILVNSKEGEGSTFSFALEVAD